VNTPAPIDIDAVARRMTTGAPAASMRAHVLERLSSRGNRRTMWLAAPVAAGVALLFLFVAVLRRPETPARETPAARATASAPAPSATSGPDAQVAQPPGGRRASSRPAPARALPLAPRLPGLPPVAPPDVLQIDAIQPAAVEIPQLHIEPIATEPLRIPSLQGTGSRQR
jgi:hypothetical protein